MNKPFLRSLAIIVCLALLSACAGSSPPAANATQAPASQVEATVAPVADPTAAPTVEPTPEAPADNSVSLKWALWDKELTIYYQALLDAYKAVKPDVTIELLDLGSADYNTVLTTQLQGGDDIDIICIKDIPGYANLVKQNFLEPLNSYISSNNVDTSLFGGTVEQLTVNNDVYTLPFRSDFWIIYYNKDLFDKAGVAYPANDLTLDQYDALARQVTFGEGPEKVFGAHYHTWRSAVQLFGVLDGLHTIVDGSYDFLKPIYERVLKEQDDGIVQSYAELKTTGTHYSAAFFNNQIAMMNMGSWFIATQIAKVESGESFSTNWGMAKYPHPDGVPAGTTLGTITGISVSSHSTKKDEAFDFVNFVSGPEGAVVIASTGTIPAIKNDDVVAAIASLPGYPTDEGSKEALKTVKTVLEMPLHDKSADIEIALNEEHDAIMTYSITVDEGIKNMNERVAEILAN
ncbi:MAG: extracellular solute-binding protein [Clostridiales bacterium]|jgi:multiple sugar transport system substrate-binding protein|nr:extracellular solute-binding protein [Clostridiales bacterium]